MVSDVGVGIWKIILALVMGFCPNARNYWACAHVLNGSKSCFLTSEAFIPSSNSLVCCYQCYEHHGGSFRVTDIHPFWEFFSGFSLGSILDAIS